MSPSIFGVLPDGREVREVVLRSRAGATATIMEWGAVVRAAKPSPDAVYITGQNQEWERSRGSLWLALGLSIFLVYVIMASTFESVRDPFVILFSVPLALAVGLALTGWVRHRWWPPV